MLGLYKPHAATVELRLDGSVGQCTVRWLMNDLFTIIETRRPRYAIATVHCGTGVHKSSLPELLTFVGLQQNA